MKKIQVFSADWCGPCNVLKSLLAEIKKVKDFDVEIIDVDTEDGAKLSSDLGIRSVPTVFFVNADGSEHSKHIGLQRRDVYESFVA